jgi:hypothetical protein
MKPIAALISFVFRRLLPLLIAGWAHTVFPGSHAAAAGIEPVTFQFTLPENTRNPFERDLWADVVVPSGQTLCLPVYFAGDGQFAVRARADEKGGYALGKITERNGNESVELTATVSGRAAREVRVVQTRPLVRRDAGDSARFVLSDGREYTPVGANLAWAPGGQLSFYRKAFAEFGKQGLNWTRVWMCHWGGLNLDWLPERMGKSPPPGILDLRVANAWDRVLAQAEEHGVYVQMVLQHHGQYTTGANPNWAQNPWNVANGGFLNTPAEFFTSPVAREITRRKYRYVVARWGHSPAILAWELFNEVHWVDALTKDRDVAAVATWHSEMAAYIRSIDVYGHLVTTSTDDLHNPLYETMDYFQPHLYAPDMIAAPQRFDVSPAQLGRPVFYGEVGDDHMKAPARSKKSGVLIVPPVWASVMGEGRYPAQPWLGADLLKTKRLGELGAVGRFLAHMNSAPRGPLSAFSPAVASASTQPLVLLPGQHWQRRPAPTITVPTDGRYSASIAEMPHFIVGAEESVADGFPPKATLLIDLPRASTARLFLADGGVKGAALQVRVDGIVAAEQVWPELPVAPGAKAEKRPREIALPLTAGKHEIVLENTGGLDWVEFGSLDFGVEIPMVAAVGKRTDDFAALWVWRRDGVFADKTPPSLNDAVVTLDDVSPGEWRVTWWNSVKGVPAETKTISHLGGALRLPVPPISRHAALILER